MNINMAQNSEARIEKIIVTKPNGLKLVGLLHVVTGRKDIVVLCHGFRSSKASPTIVTIANALEAEKLSSCRFDFSGNGESEGQFDFSNYWGEVEDIRAVVEYLTKKGFRISAILGHSKGANVVLLYASKYDDVQAVVNVSGRFHLDQGLEERFGIGFMEKLERDGYIDNKKNGEFEYRVTMKSVIERLAINMKESCSQIHQECRVLTVHGSKDKIAPVRDADEFARVLPNHTKKVIRKAGHCYICYERELVSAIVGFIKGLQPRAAF